MGIFAFIQLAFSVAQVSLTASGVEPAPLAAALTAAFNSVSTVVQGIQNGNSTVQDAQLALAALVGTLSTLKTQFPNLPAATLSQIDAYTKAAEDGLGGFAAAQKGFDVANYAPLTPVA